MFILKLCNRIDASVFGLSERNMLLGCFPRTRTRDLLRYLISVGKFSRGKNECHISSGRMRKLTVLCILRITCEIGWKQNSVSWTRKTLSQNGV